MGGGKEPFLFVGRPICADLMPFPIGKTPMPETRMVERAFIVLLAYMLTLAGKSKAYYLKRRIILHFFFQMSVLIVQTLLSRNYEEICKGGWPVGGTPAFCAENGGLDSGKGAGSSRFHCVGIIGARRGVDDRLCIRGGRDDHSCYRGVRGLHDAGDVDVPPSLRASLRAHDGRGGTCRSWDQSPGVSLGCGHPR